MNWMSTYIKSLKIRDIFYNTKLFWKYINYILITDYNETFKN